MPAHRRSRFLLGAAIAALVLSALLIVPRAQQAPPAVAIDADDIGGVVTSANGEGIEAAQIQVQHRPTGATTGTISQQGGRFTVANLETGGPYTLTIRRIGFQQATRDNIFLTLGQNLSLNIQLVEQAATLAGVTVEGEEDPLFSASKQGTSTHINEQLIQRLPTLNRNFTDMVKVTPQVSQPSSGGASAGGQYNRYNSYNIDGTNQNDRFNLNSSGGLPGAAGNGRIISADAIKEFRVLLSPTDVRQANFTGMLVNAVTKSGTNEWHGGLLYTFRNEDFSATNFRTSNSMPGWPIT